MRLLTEATDPYKIQKSLFINLLNPASLLEQRLGPYMVPTPHGLYRMGDIDPIFRSGVPYFTMHRDPNRGHALVFIEINDMNSVNSAVYDAEGKTLVSAEFMKQKTFQLSPGPTIPSRALRLIEALLDVEIHKHLSWAHQQSPHRILNLFKPEFRGMVDTDQLITEIGHVWSQVLSFICENSWCYYTLKLHNTDLFVNMCQDWRIIEWERAALPKTDE